MNLLTDRLLIRPFNLEDSEFIIQLLNTDSWIKYIGDRKISNIEQAKAYLEKGPLLSYQTHGCGLNMVALKDSNIPIGMCGLVTRDYLPSKDLGFAFLDNYVHKGYGYEAASRVLLQAKEELKLKEVMAITLPENINSNRLLLKLGFNFREEIQSPDYSSILNLYGIEL